MDADPFDLRRFLDAQEGTYVSALRELKAGEKQGHWMWYVFPQIQGLGLSPMSRKYAISGEEEARAYLEHSILGARLRECVGTVIGLEGRSAHQIFFDPDDLKFRSCMTLFARVSEDPNLFQAALDRYFGGVPDPATVAILRETSGA